ncbi:Protein Hid1 [Manis pentadactyla]|nr:Protein Hid1 [Manis pentadactyla]
MRPNIIYPDDFKKPPDQWRGEDGGGSASDGGHGSGDGDNGIILVEVVVAVDQLGVTVMVTKVTMVMIKVMVVVLVLVVVVTVITVEVRVENSTTHPTLCYKACKRLPQGSMPGTNPVSRVHSSESLAEGAQRVDLIAEGAGTSRRHKLLTQAERPETPDASVCIISFFKPPGNSDVAIIALIYAKDTEQVSKL